MAQTGAQVVGRQIRIGNDRRRLGLAVFENRPGKEASNTRAPSYSGCERVSAAGECEHPSM